MKKVVLFLVEGITDKIALEAPINKLLGNNEVLLHITDGDMTMTEAVTSQNVVREINEHVAQVMQNMRFQKEDIVGIVHLIDTDGAFIKPDAVQYEDMNKIRYLADHIKTKHVNYIRKRNEQKATIVNRLIGQNFINGIRYEIYYMSCNLEHVLHDQTNVSDREEKLRLAEIFEDRYFENPEGFLNLIRSPEIAAGVNYHDSWEYIKENCHSLQRNCNLHHYFDKN